jgi:hypothetical protein
MALRDQPYLPLYVQDFLTDEKLMECSASATGVYIRIMCVMHKSDSYGRFLLRQKDKQSDKQILNFATKLAKHLPYDLDTILAGLGELLTEGCLIIEGDSLLQKRMVKDGDISLKRSKSGKKGGDVTKNNLAEFAQAKVQANTEIEYEYENVIKVEEKKGGMGEGKGEGYVSWFTADLEIPPNTLEAAERNQHSQTGNRNTAFVKDMWKIFLLERLADPPIVQMQHKNKSDLSRYFLNFIRPKFPKKNGQRSTTATGQETEFDKF